MKYSLYIVIFQLIVFCGTSQNLVPNWSFEDTIQCPDNHSQLTRTSDWYSATNGTPDLFHECNGADYGIPVNRTGIQSAHSGACYVAILTFKQFGLIHEYIQVKLTDTLIFGKKYLISFFVNLADSVAFATNDIGIYFSSDSFYSSAGTYLALTPDIVNTGTNPLTSKTDWKEISGSYIANGDETHITIGNFSLDSLIDTVYVGGKWTDSYYYIDDVSVFLDTCSNYTTINDTICEGDSIYVAGKYYKNAGIYNDILLNADSCDSIITTNLVVHPAYTINEDTIIMQGDSIYIAGAWQKLQGTYNDSLQTIKLCDSIIITNLTIIPLPENDSIIIYNTFTPNGDGTNETFYIKNITKHPDNKLTVFNRWGSVVWEKTGYMNEWEGTDIDNEKLAAGVYYYILAVDDEKYKGYVLIIK